MGMYDSYNPDLSCPKCGGVTFDYQGKDGPCGLFSFFQGRPELTNQNDIAEECRIDNPQGHADRGLPEKFTFDYGVCKSCGYEGGLSATGFLEGGVWVRSRYNTHEHTCTRIDGVSAICDCCGSMLEFAMNCDVACCEKCHNLCEIKE